MPSVTFRRQQPDDIDWHLTSSDSIEAIVDIGRNLQMTTSQDHDNKPVVQLIGSNGNAFAIMGKVTRVLRLAGKPELVKPYMEEATSGDYDHLLQVTMKYVDVE